MKTSILTLPVALGLSLLGCPSEQPGATSQTDKTESAQDDKSTDPDKAEALPEDVQKKLKSLGYVQ